jgi:leucyl aminopeptidase
LPIQARLTTVVAAGPRPLAGYLAGLGSGTDAAAGGPHAPGPIVVPVQGADTAGIDSYLGAPAAEVIARYEATGGAGDLTGAVIGPGGSGPFLFLGLGDGSPAAMRAAGAAVGRRVAPGETLVTSALLDKPADAAYAFIVGLLLGSYRWSQKRNEPAAGDSPGEVRLLMAGPDEHADVLAAAGAVAAAVALARDLTNTPSARKTPAWLADQAVAVAAGSGLTARVWDAAELAAHGFGGLLAVGSGSARPPRLIELGYRPALADGHVVLVGKGITFDSGGLSLKPADGMKLMKTDMAGGADSTKTMSSAY